MQLNICEKFGFSPGDSSTLKVAAGYDNRRPCPEGKHEHAKQDPFLTRNITSCRVCAYQNVEEAEKRWEIAKSRFGEGNNLQEISCAQGVAMALNNLALALKGRGDTEGAEPLLRRALKVSNIYIYI